MPTQPAVDEIERLVKKFKALSTRERHAYNEDNTRKDFVLPLFRALEWNTNDMREVSAEDKISRGFVDFSFRINGIRKFLLETKRIGEDLNKPLWLQQAIDYAYHKGVTWAVLSDFEGLRILNAEVKEAEPRQAVFKEIHFEEYLTRIDELWLLSRSAIIEGTLDRKAEEVFKKSIRTPISTSLFDSLKDWRDDLYANLVAYNKGRLYTPKMIEEAVQRILDRLIFIRTAEDRDMEGDKLIALVRELRDSGRFNDLIPVLNRRFRDLDGIYNSQIFSPHLSEDLEYEPTTLSKIIEGLYESRANAVSYNFAFIDADVLGRVYEQYLGYSVAARTDAEKQVEAARKAKRKSQGIYYTPTFVVKYIVQQTLGRYLEEHGYSAARTVRVLDPACGSGSFLIEAFQVLDQYLARERGEAQGEYQIQDAMRQRQILEENLYGVDKDEQAVEVARLNLLLKALHLREKLPMLRNIVEGDSLISATDVDLEKYFGAKRKEKKPLDWEQQFPKALAEGGFDVIIGNPPWLMAGYYVGPDLDYLKSHYDSAEGKYDLYYLFIELGIRLLKTDGYFGMIVPNKFFQTQAARKLRAFLSSEKLLNTIMDFGEEQLFADATNYSCILLLRKSENESVRYVRALKDMTVVESYNVPVERLTDEPWNFGRQSTQSIFSKMEKTGIPLSEIAARFGTGVQSGADRILIVDSSTAKMLEKQIVRAVYRGRDVRRYVLALDAKQIIFPYIKKGNAFAVLDEKGFKSQYPKTHSYLAAHKKELTNRVWFGKSPTDISGKWYGLMYMDSPQSFSAPHLLTPSLSNKSNFALGNDSLFVTGTAGVTSVIFKDKLPESILYCLAILNSSLLSLYVVNHSPVFQGGYRKFSAPYLKKLPIRRINFEDPADKKRHDDIVALVNEMLELHKDYAEAERNKEDRRHALKARIDEVDAEIDALVYQLYGLTEEEIKVVEGKE